MTKKSHARQLRDQAKRDLEKNTCFDDLANIYNATSQLFEPLGLLKEVVQTRELYPYLDNPETIKEKIEIITRDSEDMSKRLTEIKAEHSDETGNMKKGGSTSPEVIIGTIGVFEKYIAFADCFQSVVSPVVAEVLDDFSRAAQKRLDAEKARMDLTDPNVITDVQVIEPASAAGEVFENAQPE